MGKEQQYDSVILSMIEEIKEDGKETRRKIESVDSKVDIIAENYVSLAVRVQAIEDGTSTRPQRWARTRQVISILLAVYAGVRIFWDIFGT